MGIKKARSGETGATYIIPLIILSSILILSGCLGYHDGPVEPDSSGRMSRAPQNTGFVFYLDQTSFYRGGRFAIRNERGNVIFRVSGDLFTRGRQVAITDASGRTLYTITRGVSGSKIIYRVYSRGKWAAKVYKRITRNYEQFYVNSRNGKDYTVQGDFRNRIYDFIYRGRSVARIMKRNSPFADKYRIDIEPYQNTMVILLTAVIIDMDNITQGGR